MMELIGILVLLALLGSLAGVLLRALRSAQPDQAQREAEALNGLGLTVSTVSGRREFSGTVDGWRVVVGRTVGPDGAEVWVRLHAPLIPPDLKIEPDRPLLGTVSDNDLHIGDGEFDRKFRIAGKEEVLFGLLNRETRSVLTRRRLVVEQSAVRVPLPAGLGDVKALRQAVEQAADLAQRLSLPESELPRRLARNAMGDDASSIRLKNLTLLTVRFTSHPATEEACRAVVRDPDVELRYESAIFFRNLDALFELAADRDAGEAARLRALMHVLAHAPPARVVPLLEKLLSSTSPFVKRAAIQALGRLRRPSDVTRLAQLVDESDGLTNAAIAKALRAIGVKESEAVLLELLAHDHSETKLQATRALGEVGTVAAVESLLAYTRGITETELKRAAREAIGHIQWRLGDVQAGGLAIAAVSGGEGGLTMASGGGELALAPAEESPEETAPSKPKTAQTRGA